MRDGDMPLAISRLKRNKAGYPVPWFVWINDEGEPDFRVIRPGGIATAMTMRICWICGGLFTPRDNRVFVIGPMCAVNRISAEPPSHWDCAEFAALHCPFLSRPNMTRREHGLPKDSGPPAGVSIRRNPGVALVWACRFDGWSVFRAPEGGWLFDVGEPRWVRWYARGRAATRAEVLESIDTGMPLLARTARKQGRKALAELDAMRLAAMPLVPSA